MGIQRMTKAQIQQNLADLGVKLTADTEYPISLLIHDFTADVMFQSIDYVTTGKYAGKEQLVVFINRQIPGEAGIVLYPMKEPKLCKLVYSQVKYTELIWCKDITTLKVQKGLFVKTIQLNDMQLAMRSKQDVQTLVTLIEEGRSA